MFCIKSKALPNFGLQMFLPRNYIGISKKTNTILNQNVMRIIYLGTTQFSSKDDFSKPPDKFKSLKDLSSETQRLWDKNGDARYLHAYNKIRVRFIMKSVYHSVGTFQLVQDNWNSVTPFEKVKILDVNSGAGILTETLANLGAKTLGLESDVNLYNVAKEHQTLTDASYRTLDYLNTSIEEYATDENAEKYDCVVASEILHYKADKKSFIQACAKVMKKRGVLVITSYNKTIKSKLLITKFLQDYIPCFPFGTPKYDMLISLEETKKLLSGYGCNTIFVTGCRYNPFKNVFNNSDSNKIFYLIHAAKSYGTPKNSEEAEKESVIKTSHMEENKK